MKQASAVQGNLDTVFTDRRSMNWSDFLEVYEASYAGPSECTVWRQAEYSLTLFLPTSTKIVFQIAAANRTRTVVSKYYLHTIKSFFNQNKQEKIIKWLKFTDGGVSWQSIGLEDRWPNALLVVTGLHENTASFCVIN